MKCPAVEDTFCDAESFDFVDARSSFEVWDTKIIKE